MTTLQRYALAALFAFVCSISLSLEAGASNLSPVLPVKCLDDNGAACRIEIYTKGTTTPYTVYTDQARTAGATTVITADSNGYFADYYCDPADTLKFIVTDNGDTEEYLTQDDVDCPLSANETTDTLAALGLDGTAAGTTVGTSGDALCKVNANCTVSGTWEFTTAPSFSSTSAAATVAPTLEIYRNSSTPAIDDDNGEILFTAEDDGSNKFNVASIIATTIDETDTEEDGQIQIVANLAGTPTDILEIGSLDSSSPATTGIDLETGRYYIGGNLLIDYSRPAAQAFDDDSTLTFAHGLSCIPDVIMYLINTTTEKGYAVGEYVDIINDNDTDRACAVGRNATNVEVTCGTTVQVVSQSTFNSENITETSWDVGVTAMCINDS